MFSKRDIIVFLAGAAAFHTVSHIFFAFSGLLPLQFWFVTLNEQLNVWAISINAVITLGLLWWASRLK